MVWVKHYWRMQLAFLGRREFGIVQSMMVKTISKQLFALIPQGLTAAMRGFETVSTLS
jgi:hypothetical protein